MASPNQNLMKLSDSPCLEQIGGEGMGRLFELFGSTVRIGRSEENDIALPMDGVSRYHAILELDGNGNFQIRDLQSKNGIIINGQKKDQALLKNGDTVQIGAYLFRFIKDSPREIMETSEPPDMSGLPAYEDTPVLKPKRNLRPIIFGGVGLLLVYALLSNNDKPETKKTDEKEETENLTPPQFANRNNSESLKGLKDPLGDTAVGKFEGTPSLKEAEQFYRKGQREYLNKNYHRAIEAFRAALSIYPNHELSQHYLKLAVYDVESDAKKQWEIAGKYYQTLQLQRAVYHYQQVIQLMQHRPTDKIVGDSERYIELCRKRLQEAELYP